MNHSNLVIKPQKSRSWYVGVGVLLILLVIGTYGFGRYFAIVDLNETKEQLTKTQQQLQETQASLEKTSENLVMQKQSSQVDNLSNKELVNSVKDLQQTQKKLEEELKLYRRIMAPEKDNEGLTIDSFQITKTDESKTFYFNIMLIQAGKQSGFLKGDLVLKVSGLLNGKNTEYDFRELGTFNEKHFKFQFQFFRNIQGFVNLPDGFEAKKVSALARTKGRRKNQKAQKQVVWQPEESQNYVRS